MSHICESVLLMGQQRQGRVAIPPGPWSQAVAAALSAIVDARQGKRDQFTADSGISRGRLPKLLDARQAWYLEDIERACQTLGLDVVGFLSGLDVPKSQPRSSDEVAAQRERRAATVGEPRQTPGTKVAKRRRRKPAQPEPESGEA